MTAGGAALTVSTGCTACGACIITCPHDALRAAPGRPVLDSASCTVCLACVEVCPTDAIVEERAL